MRFALFMCTDPLVSVKPVVSAKRVITNSDVQFRLNYASITLDIGHEGEPEYEPNNSDIFMCLVTQSREEFLYQTRKIALALTRSLVGFFIVLVAGLPSQQPDPDVSFKTSVLQGDNVWPSVEVCLLFYQRRDFDRFKTRVRDGSNFDHWQEDYHFMRLLEANGMPLTSPPEAYLRFRACVKSIIKRYRSLNSTPRAMAGLLHDRFNKIRVRDITGAIDIFCDGTITSLSTGAMYVGCVIGGGAQGAEMIFHANARDRPYYEDGLFRIALYQ
ncbi:uncharacterized protein B0H18DRAFT_289670 [Fomitopsis serialis]|uniref:uncharacterized protein n=1 Tax=Fomitopsis serialis TaxID=139415 RepID=UPI002007D71C|nr:uncharacterized protein B0H18DRAFT_289670 [Neoantrodia serialis]KAH9911875.1 hypothetical protein B0H18DRAFT_289670 [Neoantrodia serialis]